MVGARGVSFSPLLNANDKKGHEHHFYLPACIPTTSFDMFRISSSLAECILHQFEKGLS